MLDEQELKSSRPAKHARLAGTEEADHDGHERRSKEELGGAYPCPLLDPTKQHFNVGDRVQVYWVGEQRWFSGRVQHILTERVILDHQRAAEQSVVTYQVVYDDGEMLSHGLHNNIMRLDPCSSSNSHHENHNTGLITEIDGFVIHELRHSSSQADEKVRARHACVSQ